MARVETFTGRDGLDEAQTEAYDGIFADRGTFPLPFVPLLDAPEIAARTGALGAALARGSLPPDVREVAIVATAHERDCRFEMTIHTRRAADAGVEQAVIDSLVAGGAVAAEPYGAVVEFVRQACRQGSVDSEAFEAARSTLGEEGLAELVALIGYYSYLALTMAVYELD